MEHERMVREILGLLESSGETLAIAESCTGGRVTDGLVCIPGASAVVVGGIVAYAPRVKVSHLGVDERLVTPDTIVSCATAQAMACGVRKTLGATWGIATTGFAGPGGGNARYGVHCAAIGIAGPGIYFSRMCHREGMPKSASDAADRELFMGLVADDLYGALLRAIAENHRKSA